MEGLSRGLSWGPEKLAPPLNIIRGGLGCGVSGHPSDVFGGASGVLPAKNQALPPASGVLPGCFRVAGVPLLSKYNV